MYLSIFVADLKGENTHTKLTLLLLYNEEIAAPKKLQLPDLIIFFSAQ